MIARTNKFKEEIAKLGKEIDFKIALHINDRLITQDSKFITTQENMRLIVEQFNEEEIDEVIHGENIYNVSVVRKGDLLSTMMKEIDFEIDEDLRIGNVVDCSFGLKVDGEYEYIDYGRFIVYSKEHNEDTNTYSYVAFDSMLFSMVEVDNTSIIQGVTVKKAIENICDKVGLTVNITAQDVTNLPNLNKTINENAFNDIQMTYRDVLDMICQCLGVSMVSDGKVLYLKTLNDTIVDTFDENYLKDTNVKFSDKYMINSVVLSRSEDNDIIYRRDEESIAKNGVHEFKIKDNLIMLYDDREDYINEIFDQLNGVEYYINDFSSPGITYLEPLDFYNINIGNKTYKCLLLNDEIKIQQGLEETIYTDMPEETITNYTTSSKTDKEVSFIVDKQNGQIKSRVTQDEMESAIEQSAEEINLVVATKVGDDEVISKINQSAEQIQIEADKISLAGKTIQMTSDNVAINSTNFSVDKNGNMSCSNASITGGNITLYGGEQTPKITIINPNQTNTHVEIGSGILNGYDSSNTLRSSFFYNIGNLILRSSTGTYVAHSGGGSYYKQTSSGNDVIQIVPNDGSITCISLIQTSEEKYKKNFEKLENALDIIKNIDIYKYNLKEEKDNDKKHIGFVIGDNYNYSKEITSKQNDGVDIYNFVSVCCKAIQEQQEIIENLQSRIEKLEGGR